MNSKITTDDPRLTTYALGELEDPNERRLVENALASHAELRAYVDEIQSLGNALKDEFANEATPDLERVIADEPMTKKPSSWRYAWPVGLAACIAVVVAVQMKPHVDNENAMATAASGVSPEARAAEVEALEKQLNDQAVKVEEARLKMLDLAERYRIVDLAALGDQAAVTGDPVTGQGSILTSRMADTYKAEAAIAQLKMQKQALDGLEGERLVQSAVMLDIDDPTLQTLIPHYQEAKLQRQGLLDSGLAEEHPNVQETTARLERTEGMLLAATESVKQTLDTKLQMAEHAMTLGKNLEETVKDDSSDERRKVADYSEASKEYELQKGMLAQLQSRLAVPNLSMSPNRPATMPADEADGATMQFAMNDPFAGKPVDVVDADAQFGDGFGTELGMSAEGIEKPATGERVTPNEQQWTQTRGVFTAGLGGGGALVSPTHSGVNKATPSPTNRDREATRGWREDSDHGGRHMPAPIPMPDIEQTTESYAPTQDNDFKTILNPGEERSTFSTDVDTASYTNIRRFLSNGQRPPRDAVRVEEMINYFDYAYPNPDDEELPFTMNLEVSDAPWKPGHRLVRIGLKARDVAVDRRPDSNLVFLVDVSGSMKPYNKLPLLKQCLTSLTRGLTERDFVSIVVYSGESRVVLEPTNGGDKTRILGAIDSLRAEGSTNGESGIRLAYDLAKKHAKANGANRVLLATDGDFNVGVTSTPQLIEMAKARAKEEHIFLTVLGFGEGNVQDDRMEQLANQVDGAYHYIDSEQEGHKVLIEEMSATLVTVAKDVKLQVEFNPAKVKQYRLIGYANRLLQNRDFRDDSKDAGEMGAGHRVTAFYEIVPTGHLGLDPSEPPLKYRQPEPERERRPVQPEMVASDELVTVRVSYKAPQGTTSQQQEFTLEDNGTRWNDASEDFRFAASVAAFGMRLRESPHCGADLKQIHRWADAARTRDEYGRRKEFVELINAAQRFH